MKSDLEAARKQITTLHVKYLNEHGVDCMCATCKGISLAQALLAVTDQHLCTQAQSGDQKSNADIK